MDTTTPAPWPEHVLYRYLTRAAEITGDPNATVDIVRDPLDGPDGKPRYNGACRSCHVALNRRTEWGLRNELQHWAQDHASKCRALPRPEDS